MKQIEITVRLNEKIEEAISKLENNGFKKIRESDIDDIYLSNLDIKMKDENDKALEKKNKSLNPKKSKKEDDWDDDDDDLDDDK